MRLLNEILTEINTGLDNNVNLQGIHIKFWNETSLHVQDNKTFPIVNGGDGDGSVISFNDDYALQIYHRVLDVGNDNDTSNGYGSEIQRFRYYNMRLVGIGLISKFPQRTYETNTDILSMVSISLTENLTYELLIPGDEQPDKMAVMDSEFNNHEWDHLKFDLIAFWIDYQIQQRIENC